MDPSMGDWRLHKIKIYFSKRMSPGNGRMLTTLQALNDHQKLSYLRFNARNVFILTADKMVQRINQFRGTNFCEICRISSLKLRTMAENFYHTSTQSKET